MKKHDNSSDQIKDYEKRIAELKQTLKQKQMLIDFYTKMIELAEKDLKIDIINKSDSKISAGIDKKNQK